FMLSRECQQFLAKFGRLPTRKDVQSNPPGMVEMLTQKKVITVLMAPDEERKWQRQFDQLFKGRGAANPHIPASCAGLACAPVLSRLDHSSRWIAGASPATAAGSLFEHRQWPCRWAARPGRGGPGSPSRDRAQHRARRLRARRGLVRVRAALG